MDDAVEVRRLLPAEPERVFAAWIDPAWLSRWMSPVGHARVEADVRVGGLLRVVMVGDGREIEHVGEYLEVSPPHRLSFTWRSAYTGDRHSRVTVELTEHGDLTELVLRHELLPDGSGDAHAGGWSSMIDRLEQQLEPRHQKGRDVA